MKVFIIDDYLDFAHPIRDNFEFKGYEAEYCCLSSNAKELALRFRPNWIIFDIRLPYKSGIELFKELDSEANFEFSAVFYSAYLPDPEWIEQLNKLGAPDEAKIEKTTDLERDVTEKIIPALEVGYLKGGKKNG